MKKNFAILRLCAIFYRKGTDVKEGFIKFLKKISDSICLIRVK